MKCNSSKFLLISILTFAVGFGIVQVWQDFTVQNNLPTSQQTTKDIEPVINNQPQKIDFCDEIKKNPNYPNAKPNRNLLTVSGGVLNQRVCSPLPYREIDIQSRDWTKDYIMIQVTVDENGFILSATTVTNPKFGKHFEKIAKGFRVRPTVLSGINFKCSGVLIFYPNEHYSKR